MRSLLCVSPTLATAFAAVQQASALNNNNNININNIMNLQMPHPELTPAEMLRKLADDCERFGIDKLDVYGDFTLDSTKSYLRRFESDIAMEFQKEDGVFMPSGVMAQQIALLIHASQQRKQNQKQQAQYFACHHSSHLLLHEQDGFRELLGMEALVIRTNSNNSDQHHDGGIHIPPMGLHHVQDSLEQFKNNHNISLAGELISTLIIELPHRELGGKCTPLEDLHQIRELCHREGVKLHCDGARIFEATTGYSSSNKSHPTELTNLFDTVYISFYKGLAGASGAMLLGSKEFCDEARIWLRRFGGNLYTLLPYAVSGWAGYKRHWLGDGNAMTFLDKKEKLARIVATLSADAGISSIVTFDPVVPEVNMVHGYLCMDANTFAAIHDKVEKSLGIRVLNRVRTIGDSQSKFEWTMGEANGNIPDEAFLRGWKALAEEVHAHRGVHDKSQVKS
jgi:threonine aldolase